MLLTSVGELLGEKKMGKTEFIHTLDRIKRKQIDKLVVAVPLKTPPDAPLRGMLTLVAGE